MTPRGRRPADPLLPLPPDSPRVDGPDDGQIGGASRQQLGPASRAEQAMQPAQVFVDRVAADPEADGDLLLAVPLEEVESARRAPVLRRYLDCAPGAWAHFPLDRRAPLQEFERIAARYPVFRITAPSGGASPAESLSS